MAHSPEFKLCADTEHILGVIGKCTIEYLDQLAPAKHPVKICNNLEPLGCAGLSRRGLGANVTEQSLSPDVFNHQSEVGSSGTGSAIGASLELRNVTRAFEAIGLVADDSYIAGHVA